MSTILLGREYKKRLASMHLRPSIDMLISGRRVAPGNIAPCLSQRDLLMRVEVRDLLLCSFMQACVCQGKEAAARTDRKCL